MPTISWDLRRGSNWTSAYLGATKLAQFDACMNNALAFFSSMFQPSRDCTLVWFVDVDQKGGLPMSGAGDSNYSYAGWIGSGYANFKSFLLGLPDAATDPFKASAYAGLPASDPDPTGNGWVNISDWLATMAGITSSGGNAGGGLPSTGFASFLDASDTTGVTGGGLYPVILHEAREHFGGYRSNSFPGNSTLDLFSFTAINTRYFGKSANSYFSTDNGQTNKGTFNAPGVGVGDAGDWNQINSPFDHAIGTTQIIRPEDIQSMSVMGLRLTPAGRVAAGASSSPTGARLRLH